MQLFHPVTIVTFAEFDVIKLDGDSHFLLDFGV